MNYLRKKYYSPEESGFDIEVCDIPVSIPDETVRVEWPPLLAVFFGEERASRSPWPFAAAMSPELLTIIIRGLVRSDTFRQRVTRFGTAREIADYLETLERYAALRIAIEREVQALIPSLQPEDPRQPAAARRGSGDNDGHDRFIVANPLEPGDGMVILARPPFPLQLTTLHGKLLCVDRTIFVHP